MSARHHEGSPAYARPLQAREPRAAWSAQQVAVAAAIAMPLATLAFQGGANGSYFLLALASLVGLALHAAGQRAAPPAAVPGLAVFCVAMALPMLAVASNQIFTADLSGRYFDAPLRLLLAIPVACWLARCPPHRLRHVVWGMGLGALVGAGVLAAVSDFGATGRPAPGFATAITFGNVALVLGLFSLIAIPWRITAARWETPFKLLCGMAGLYGSLLSQSRGGWLALPALVALLIVLARIPLRAKLGAAAAAVVLIGAVYAASPVVQERVTLAMSELVDYATGGNADTSIGLRMQFWRASLEMFAAHPLTGVGAQNIRGEFEARAARGEMSASAATYNHSHNDALWYMASFGLPGLIALLAVYLAPLAIFVRAARSADIRIASAGRMGAVLAVSYLMFGLTEAMFAITMNAAFYGGMLAVLLALTRPDATR